MADACMDGWMDGKVKQMNVLKDDKSFMSALIALLPGMVEM